MSQAGKGSSIVFMIVIGLILQFFLVKIERIDTPNKAVVEFAKAYFRFDPAMAERLCDERKAPEDFDVVDKYIRSAINEAKERGFGPGYIKSRLSEIKTETMKRDKKSARIKFTCARKESLLRSFFAPKTYHVSQVVDVALEDGVWKVCGDIFELP